MRQLTVSECKEYELAILKRIKDFCNENNIRYYLCGGTMIGAIRHGGFIPWDDDIDIIMPRPDYRKFISLFPKTGLGNYQLLSPYNDDDCCIVFSKVYDDRTIKHDREVAEKYWKYGVDIDIFPTDGVPKDEDLCNKYFKQQYRDFHLFLALVGGYSFSGSFLKKLIKYNFTYVVKRLGTVGLLDAHRIALRINDRAEQNSIDESDKVAISIFPHYGKHEIVDKEGFLKQIEVEFEDDVFTAPSNYDDYLTSVYGDYMRLPPVDKQVTHHLSNCYLKEGEQ